VFSILLFKEIREHIMTFRFTAMMVTMFVLILFSTWVIGGNYVEKAENFRKLSDMYKDEASNIFVPSQLVPTIGYMPTSLSIFAQAESKLFGNFVRISRNQVPESADISLTNNELLDSTPTFDVLLVISVILSLFGILMSYDAVNGERERGTLKFMMSYSISRSAVYMSKFCGLQIVLMIPFLVSLMSALIVLQTVFGLSFSFAEWGILILMLLAVFAYSAVFVGVGLLTSATMRSSATSVVFSVLLWATLVFFIPLSANKAAEMLVELRPEDELENLRIETRKEKREIILEEWNDITDKMTGDILAHGAALDATGYHANWILDGNVNFFKAVCAIVTFSHPHWMERANTVWDLVQQHKQRKREQANVAEYLSIPSPAYHLRSAFTLLSGSSYQQQKHFLERARYYREEFVNNLESRGFFGENASLYVSRIKPEDSFSEENYHYRMEGVKQLRDKNPEQNMSQLDYFNLRGPLPENLMPEFNYSYEVADIEKVLLHLSALFIFTLLFMTIGLVAFNSYDLR
jgi:ABC-type transport system involved in multi-copper enzyme maturation permease subunit